MRKAYETARQLAELTQALSRYERLSEELKELEEQDARQQREIDECKAFLKQHGLDFDKK